MRASGTAARLPLKSCLIWPRLPACGGERSWTRCLIRCSTAHRPTSRNSATRTRRSDSRLSWTQTTMTRRAWSSRASMSCVSAWTRRRRAISETWRRTGLSAPRSSRRRRTRFPTCQGCCASAWATASSATQGGGSPARLWASATVSRSGQRGRSCPTRSSWTTGGSSTLRPTRTATSARRWPARAPSRTPRRRTARRSTGWTSSLWALAPRASAAPSR